MRRDKILQILATSLRSSSTSSGLRAGQHTKVLPIKHQYPKVNAVELVSQDLNAMVGEIHQELNDELKTNIELGEMAR